jgi:hypothetical protein
LEKLSVASDLEAIMLRDPDRREPSMHPVRRKGKATELLQSTPILTSAPWVASRMGDDDMVEETTELLPAELELNLARPVGPQKFLAGDRASMAAGTCDDPAVSWNLSASGRQTCAGAANLADNGKPGRGRRAWEEAMNLGSGGGP